MSIHTYHLRVTFKRRDPRRNQKIRVEDYPRIVGGNEKEARLSLLKLIVSKGFRVLKIEREE